MFSKQLFKIQNLTTKILKNLFIQTQTTPNPNFLKFLPTGKQIMEDGTMDFVAEKYATISPLALKLFHIDGVNRVFYGKDYISISKNEESDWAELKPQIFEKIMDEQPLFTDVLEHEDTKINDDDTEVVQMIKQILDTRVRPITQEDGGDIVFRDFDEQTGIVHLYLKGSCSGCPSSSITLKQGIEKMLIHYVPEVNSVEAEDYQG